MQMEDRIPIVVGVTGHRALRPQDEGTLTAAVRAQLSALRERCPSSPLVLLTSLAEGADLLCADVAAELGFRIWAALPAALAEFERDHGEAARTRLLHRVESAERCFVAPDTEAVPAGGADRAFRYRQAGIFVATHCHVLLALWDGGPGTAAACGTAEAVDFALRGAFAPADGALPKSACGAVWHILTPRAGAEGQAGALAVLGEEEALWDELDKTEEFNRLAADAAVNNRGLLPETPADDALLPRMERVRACAGALSAAYARRYRRVLAALALSGALFTAGFLLYDEAQAIWLILVCGALLAVAGGILRYAGRSACHRRYLEYRALAECLRVQIFLRYAGSAVEAAGLLTWTQREETAWIARALAALTAGPPPAEAHDVRAYWVEEQRRYHAAAVNRRAREGAASDRVVRAALIVSIALYCAAVVFELLCGGVLCRAAWPVGNAEAYRTFLKIALGLLSAVTLLIAGYYGRLSLPRMVADHRKMERFYAEMGAVLARCGQTDALLTLLAREELIENGNWCSYQRDNTPDLSI